MVASTGTAVFADPDGFRAALDDFVDEAQLSVGETNLLVDAVRLGAYTRLTDQLDRGATPTRAVEAVGDQLARDRGTTESETARWAVAVLGFSVGAVSAAEVSARATLAWSERISAGTDSGGVAPTAPKPAGAVETVPSAPPTEVPDPGRDADRKVGWRVLAVVGCVIAVLVGAGLITNFVLAGDPNDADESSGEPSSGSSDRSPRQESATPALAVKPVVDQGVRSSREYRISGRRFVSTTVLKNATDQPITRYWAEVIPKRLAERLAAVRVQPEPTGVIDSDPIVYWKVRLGAGAERQITWSVALPRGQDPGEDFLRRAAQWHKSAMETSEARVALELSALETPSEIESPSSQESTYVPPPSPTFTAPATTDGDGGNGNSDPPPPPPTTHPPSTPTYLPPTGGIE